MSNSLKIELQGADKLEKRLEDATKTIQIEISAKITDGAQAIAAEAKQRAPVNFGFLKNFISAIPAEKSASGFRAVVVSSAAYSAYVEFGTGTKVEVPSDLIDFAIQFKGTHEVIGMRAQPFFFPSVKRIIPIIQNDVKKTLDKI